MELHRPIPPSPKRAIPHSNDRLLNEIPSQMPRIPRIRTNSEIRLLVRGRLEMVRIFDPEVVVDLVADVVFDATDRIAECPAWDFGAVFIGEEGVGMGDWAVGFPVIVWKGGGVWIGRRMSVCVR